MISLRRHLNIAACYGLAGFLLSSPLVALAAEHEEHGSGHGGGIPHSLIYAAINFTILIILLSYFLRKPAKEFFASRGVLIKKSIDESKDLKINAENKYREYETRLKNIETETQNLINQLKQDGELEKNRLLESAQKQITTLQETHQKILDQELRRAKEELKKQAVAMAANLAEELIKKNISSQDQNKILEQYLNKLENAS